MSNDLIKAAEEARKFVRSLQSLTQVASFLEDVGSVEQAKAETAASLEKFHVELAQAKADTEQAKSDAAKMRAEAKQKADQATLDAQLRVDRINGEVKAQDDSLRRKISEMEKSCRQHHRQIELVRAENAKLAAECESLKAQVVEGADAVKKAKAAVAALA